MVDSIESNVMKHLIFRMGVTSSMFLGYSTLVLGNSISPNVVYNALAAAGSAAAAETGVRYLMPHITHAKSQGLNSGLNIALEADATVVIYSQLFPRIFPAIAGSVSMQQLAMTGALIDASSQLVAPKVAAMLEGGSAY